MTVFGPDALVYAVSEVSSFLAEYRAITLATLVLLEASRGVLTYTSVIHRYEDVLALRSIEALEREALVAFSRNVRPQQVLVMLGRFDTSMYMLIHCPTITLESFDSQFVVTLLGVSTASVSISVSVEVQGLA